MYFLRNATHLHANYRQIGREVRLENGTRIDQIYPSPTLLHDFLEFSFLRWVIITRVGAHARLSAEDLWVLNVNGLRPLPLLIALRLVILCTFANRYRHSWIPNQSFGKPRASTLAPWGGLGRPRGI